MSILHPPGLICFNIYQVPLSWTTGIHLIDSSGASHPYRLCGIVYYNGVHFTSRIRDAGGNIWYVDNKKFCQQEQLPVNFSYVNLDSTMQPYSAFFMRHN